MSHPGLRRACSSPRVSLPWRFVVATAIVMLIALPLAQAQERDVVATARALVESGQPKRALAILDTHLAAAPDDVPALVWRGAARLKAALDDALAALPAQPPRLKVEWTKSLADLDRALILDPSSAEGYFWRGYWYAVDGKNLRAIAEYDQAIAADPTVANYWCERGIAKERRLDLRGARSDYLAALVRDPAHANAREWLASVEPRLGLPATTVTDPGLAKPPTSSTPVVLPPPPTRPSQPGTMPPATQPATPPLLPTATTPAPAPAGTLAAEAQEALETFSRAVLFVAGKDTEVSSLYRAIYEGLDGEFVEIELVREADGFLNIGSASAVPLGRNRATVDALIRSYRQS